MAEINSEIFVTLTIKMTYNESAELTLWLKKMRLNAADMDMPDTDARTIRDMIEVELMRD